MVYQIIFWKLTFHLSFQMRANGATITAEQLGILYKRIDDLSILEFGFRRLAGTTVNIVRIEIEGQPTEVGS